MSDLVERLRLALKVGLHPELNLLRESADEIECLRLDVKRQGETILARGHEVERLRAGLREIANLDAPHQSAWVAVGLLDTALEIARRLLAREEE